MFSDRDFFGFGISSFRQPRLAEHYTSKNDRNKTSPLQRTSKLCLNPNCQIRNGLCLKSRNLPQSK